MAANLAFGPQAGALVSAAYTGYQVVRAGYRKYRQRYPNTQPGWFFRRGGRG